MFSLILDKPICANLQKMVQGVGQGRTTDVLCPVLAHPPPTRFTWKFNNSVEALELSPDNFWFNETHSKLHYIPDEDTDYGLLYCWAHNPQGSMSIPCIFQLIPAGWLETFLNKADVGNNTWAMKWMSKGYSM